MNRQQALQKEELKIIDFDNKELIDCLFVHVPKLSSYYRPIDDFMNITYMPMGVFAMADLLISQGFSSQIIHLGVEWIEDKKFSIIEFIKSKKVKVVALSLFWHYQSYDVIEIVKKIKINFPDIFIVLGGFTASYFSEEILNSFKEVDAIIKGYGEKPILELIKEIKKKENKNLHNVHNLLWRNKQEIVINKEHCFISEEIFNNLRFTNLTLLRNYPVYVKCFNFPLAWVKNFSKDENYKKASIRTTLFPLCIGRGCPVECSWCGGSTKAQEKMNFGNKVIFRPLEKVIESIIEAQKYGYETIHVCFDPYPKGDYYLCLFRRIREKNIKIGFYFESWALPTYEFIEEFKKTFNNNSIIAISPESGLERVRKANRGYCFSNAELLRTLDFMEKLGVNFDIFFSIGLPFEKIRDVYDTKSLVKKIRKRYKRIKRLMTWSIQLEPGSPLYENPQRFGAVTERKSFMDFYHSHANYFSDTYSALGYNIPDYFEEKQLCPDAKTFAKRLQEVKCRHFCFLNPDPRKSSHPLIGRLYCKFRQISWILKGKGIKKLTSRETFN